jgi:type IV pilus assembly protein PilN
MIKINLVAQRKAAKHSKSVSVASSSSMGGGGAGASRSMLLVGIVAIGFVVAGGWWWTLNSKVNHWNDELQKADAELKRLESAIEKSEEFEQQKELLARKITLITDLKRQQEVPVHILDQVSLNLPEFLWLESMTANKTRISISGKATNYSSVSTFYTNLTESGYFADVELGRTFEIPAGVSFSLTCGFSSEMVTQASQVKP